MNDSPKFFPSTSHQALALEYVRAHASEADSPEAMLAMYDDAYKRICDAVREGANRKSRNTQTTG